MPVLPPDCRRLELWLQQPLHTHKESSHADCPDGFGNTVYRSEDFTRRKWRIAESSFEEITLPALGNRSAERNFIEGTIRWQRRKLYNEKRVSRFQERNPGELIQWYFCRHDPLQAYARLPDTESATGFNRCSLPAGEDVRYCCGRKGGTQGIQLKISSLMMVNPRQAGGRRDGMASIRQAHERHRRRPEKAAWEI